MSKRIKPNCQKCYFGGAYIIKAKLALCKCSYSTEHKIEKFDKFYNRKRSYVKRNKWDEECNCEYFIPTLNEYDGDFELEENISFDTSFDCPFCGEYINVYDVGVETIKIVLCENCEKQIAVEGKRI